ncbi:transmembrane protein 119b [Aplochiton taeniatus]
MLRKTLLLIGLSVVLWSCSILATPLPFHVSMEGSADGGEPDSFVPTLSFPATSESTSESPTTPGGPHYLDQAFLTKVMDLLQENFLLILVASSLLILIIFIICCAVFMSRRRKVNAYYPSSYPATMYVNQRDKTGGTKPFIEVPDKSSNRLQAEPVDSSKQLQADIMRAVKNLRTPTKPDLEERKVVEPSLNDAGQIPDGGQLQTEETVTERETSQAPEPSQLGGLSDYAALASSSPERQPLIPAEQASLQEEESAESPSDSECLEAQQVNRPLSHLTKSDCTPTVPMITGEKTAF